MPERGRHVAMLVRNPYTHDTRVEKEAATLVGAGYHVTVVADAAAGLPERETRGGASVWRIPPVTRSVPGARLPLQDWRLANRLTSLVPDVIHAHDSNALLPVALAARRLDVPFVYDAHELWLHRPRRDRGRLYEDLFHLYYRVLQRWAIPRSAAQITVSAPIAAHLARHYRLPAVRLVPNYPEVTPPATPRSLHALADGRIPDEAPIVLHLGGIMAERGLEQLVDATAASAHGAHLALLGDGGHWPSIERRARDRGVSDRVHQLGPVPPDEVVEYSASATVGVQATVPTGLNNRYSLPNKLFQYMAAGIPVVASDFPQIREIVTGARCGVVVDTTSGEAVGQAIDAILADPAQARAMGERGRAAIESRFNWDASARELLALYAALPK